MIGSLLSLHPVAVQILVADPPDAPCGSVWDMVQLVEAWPTPALPARSVRPAADTVSW